MVIAPFVPMGLYGNAWNDWIAGVIVAVLGFTMPADQGWRRYLAGIVGLWMTAPPHADDHAHGALEVR